MQKEHENININKFKHEHNNLQFVIILRCNKLLLLTVYFVHKLLQVVVTMIILLL